MYFNQTEFGQRIRKLRKVNGLTQEELAKQLNIGHVHMNSIENGRKGCSLDLLLELSELFDVSTDYLLTGKSQSNEEIKIKLLGVIDDLKVILRDLEQK